MELKGCNSLANFKGLCSIAPLELKSYQVELTIFVMVYRSCGSIRLSVPKGWVLIVTNTHKSEASIKLEESYMVLGNNKPSDLLFEIFGSSCFVKPLSLSSLVFKS